MSINIIFKYSHASITLSEITCGFKCAFDRPICISKNIIVLCWSDRDRILLIKNASRRFSDAVYKRIITDSNIKHNDLNFCFSIWSKRSN